MRFVKGSFVSNPGSPFRHTYAPKVTESGRVVLVVSGVENTDEFIQSHKESTDIHEIMKRVYNGQIELLNKRPGSFGDFTKTPKTFAEALQLQIDSHRMFDSLPIEIQNKFNNDPNEYFVKSGSKEWFDALGSLVPDEVKEAFYPSKPIDPVVVEPEVKE